MTKIGQRSTPVDNLQVRTIIVIKTLSFLHTQSNQIMASTQTLISSLNLVSSSLSNTGRKMGFSPGWQLPLIPVAQPGLNKRD
jgi:hypothetical protein